MTSKQASRAAAARAPGNALALGLSLFGHLVLFTLIILLPKLGLNTGVDIIAAGPGEGIGSGTGDALQVGVASPAELFSVAPWLESSTLGRDPESRVSNEPLERTPEESTDDDAVRLDDSGKPKTEVSKALHTDRPLTESPARPFSGKPTSATSTGTSAILGPTPGSPFPAVSTSPGIGMGSGGGSGIPGGSEYGRRLQQALSSYYRYHPPSGPNPRFVILRVHLDRAGRVLSITDGRLDQTAILKSSGNIVTDSRVTGAILELNRNPIPFPVGFLVGNREAVAEIYFQY